MSEPDAAPSVGPGDGAAGRAIVITCSTRAAGGVYPTGAAR